MTIKQKIREDYPLYFITFSCYKWLNLFDIVNYYHKIYNWFDLLKSKEIYTCGYVIMPNHVHLLLGTHLQNISIEKHIGNGKRFMAYEIVRFLDENNLQEILKPLNQGVVESEKKKGKKHQVFHSSFDIKPCYTEKFVLQKLDYIHQNPVSGKWNLVDDYTEYKHSSAQFYELSKHGIYEVIHYKEFLG